MLTYAQAALLGILQGHYRTLPYFEFRTQCFDRRIYRNGTSTKASLQFLAFVVDDASRNRARPGFFYREWIAVIATSMFRSLANLESTPTTHPAKLGWLSVVSTIPAGLIGLLFRRRACRRCCGGDATRRVLRSLLTVRPVRGRAVAQARREGAGRRHEIARAFVARRNLDRDFTMFRARSRIFADRLAMTADS